MQVNYQISSHDHLISVNLLTSDVYFCSYKVMKLKAILREQATRKQVSTGHTEISGEETVESTPVAIRSSNGKLAECNYVDEYNPVTSPYWAVLPSYP